MTQKVGEKLLILGFFCAWDTTWSTDFFYLLLLLKLIVGGPASAASVHSGMCSHRSGLNMKLSLIAFGCVLEPWSKSEAACLWKQ